MKILVVADYYLPGFKGGGAVRSMINLIDWLGDQFEFYILTADRDLGDNTPYPDMHYGEWEKVGGAQVRYLKPEEWNLFALRRIINTIQYDTLYLNSFFSSSCVKTIFLRWLRFIPHKPVIIAPRGQFFDGALALKTTKKRLYLAAARLLRFYDDADVIWHATSAEEQAAIQAFFPSSAANAGHNLIARDLTVKAVPRHQIYIPKGEVTRIIFLSRIARNKNLDYALRVLAQVKGLVEFDIFGPIEDAGYWSECQSMIAALPTHVHVEYKGEVTPDQVINIFAKYHLFLFPSAGENFGHVIWEALYAGCIVLTSDRTPWKDLESLGIGWALPLEAPDQFLEKIETVIGMSENDFHTHADAANRYAMKTAANEEVLEANRNLFLTAHPHQYDSLQESPTILIVAQYYLPSQKGGGSVRTLDNVVTQLGEEFTFYVVTTDRDVGNSIPYPDLTPRSWTQVGNALVRYATPTETTIFQWGKVIKEKPHDLLYVNSFFAPICILTMWMYHWRLIPQKPLILAPRGEFYPGALELKSAKKRLYLAVAKILRIYQGITWQASSEGEKQTIQALFSDAEVVIAPDLTPKAPQQPHALIPKAETIRMIFLSRLSRKKNLTYALNILKQVKAPVIFDIYGPIEDDIYWRECQQIINTLPAHIQVTYKGLAHPDEVIQVFAGYHLFLFPTLGENFGHVIWEALYAGCLVLTSDQTPWDNLESAGVGWSLPLSQPDQFVRIIEQIAAMPQAEFDNLVLAARQFAAQTVTNTQIIDANRTLFIEQSKL